MIPNDLIEFSGFSGISIDFLDYQDIGQQGLTAKADRDFQHYLVCRLICVLDFIFTDPRLVRHHSWLADCRTTAALVYRFCSINTAYVAANARCHGPRDPKSPTFDDFYSVPPVWPGQKCPLLEERPTGSLTKMNTQSCMSVNFSLRMFGSV